ncbi:MAG: hypothetical protein ACAH95_02580 [Fimbriimonas sp.]
MTATRIACLCALLLVSFGCKGKADMSKAEANESASEIEAMVKGANIADPTTFNTGTAANTRLGKALQEMIKERQALEAELEKKTAGVADEGLFTDARMGTAKGRALSISEAKELRKADEWYYREVDDMIVRFGRKMKAEFETVPPNLAQNRKESREMKAKNMAVHDSIAVALAFVDKAKPKLDKKGGLVFANEAQEMRFGELISKVAETSEELTKAVEDMTKRKEAQMKEGLAKMKG